MYFLFATQGAGLCNDRTTEPVLFSERCISYANAALVQFPWMEVVA